MKLPVDQSPSWPRIRLRASVYVEREGKALLLYDPVYRGGCWILPGGEVEFDETVFKAAEREVFEETGLVVMARRLWHLRELWEPERDFPDRIGAMRRTFELIFIGDYISGEINIQHNPSRKADGIPRVKECRWIPVRDLGPKINGAPVHPQAIYLEQPSKDTGMDIGQVFLEAVNTKEGF